MISRYQVTDIFINIISPLLLGSLLYYSVSRNNLPQFLNNYLPDCLWAYSFQSTILIIWKRKINIPWSIVVVCSGFIFELLQFEKILSGTGDIMDFLLYTVFVLLAISLNNFFSSHYKINNIYE